YIEPVRSILAFEVPRIENGTRTASLNFSACTKRSAPGEVRARCNSVEVAERCGKEQAIVVSITVAGVELECLELTAKHNGWIGASTGRIHSRICQTECP